VQRLLSPSEHFNRVFLPLHYLVGAFTTEKQNMKKKSVAGMYEVADPTYPQVKVGNFTICRQDDKSVWIQTEEGEGAQFPDDLFEKAISEFYCENF
jgi:hypothetical protein